MAQKKRNIVEESIKMYSLLILCCFSPFLPYGSFPKVYFSLWGRASPLLPWALAQGWNPFSTPPFPSQQSFQSPALDSLLWSGFGLMSSDDGDKWWWHSPLMSGMCQWSFEFIMKWFEFRLIVLRLLFFLSFQLKKKAHYLRIKQSRWTTDDKQAYSEDETLLDVTVE